MNFKVAGSISIVAGTAIGAGMLALPIATAGLGMVPAICLLVLAWLLSVYTGLLMLEVNLRSGTADNLHVIAGKTLGHVGQVCVALAFLCLLYALTAAYLTGGAALLIVRTQSLFDSPLSGTQATLLFGAALGLFAALGVAPVERLSRALLLLMVLLLASIILFLFPAIDVKNLLVAPAIGNPLSMWMVAIPVVVTSFGFQVCIASLVPYLGGRVVDLRRVLVIGSALPLVCYILWLLVSVGTVGAPEITSFEGGALTSLVAALQASAQNAMLSEAIGLFADLALVTSFLGVTLSLFDFLAELTGFGATLGGRCKTWLITFVPPLLWVLLFPRGFVMVLGFAAIPLVVLVFFLPVAMARVQRGRNMPGYQVCGGPLALLLVTVLGAAIIASQLYAALWAS